MMMLWLHGDTMEPSIILGFAASATTDRFDHGQEAATISSVLRRIVDDGILSGEIRGHCAIALLG